jgi:hypothetical protein
MDVLASRAEGVDVPKEMEGERVLADIPNRIWDKFGIKNVILVICRSGRCGWDHFNM